MLAQKLNDIEIAIRSHYFDDKCKHKTINECNAFIVSRIIKIIEYKPRVVFPGSNM